MKSDQRQLQQNLALCCNNRAWELAKGPEPRHDLGRALTLARRAVELAPGEDTYLNTMGVVLYRTGRYADAITTVERSLAARRAQTGAFDLFLLAMAHHRLGHQDQARDCYNRAVRWVQDQKNLPSQKIQELSSFRAAAQKIQELSSFRADAESVLAGPAGELPEDVFAPK
jgi:Flp pilus assembly protein TadD